jgi:hypothetical protein
MQWKRKTALALTWLEKHRVGVLCLMIACGVVAAAARYEGLGAVLIILAVVWASTTVPNRD